MEADNSEANGVEEIVLDTPPQDDAVEWVEVGGEGRTEDVTPNGASQGMPTGAPELTPTAEEPVGGECALTIRLPQAAPGSGPAAESPQL